MPRLVLVTRLRIDRYGSIRARGAARTVLSIVRMDRIGQTEADPPSLRVEPVAAAGTAEAVAEDALARARTLVGPVARKQVDRRPQLMLAMPGESALRGRLAESVACLVGPAREYPALRAEAPVRRLGSPLDPLSAHLIEHPVQLGRRVAAKAIVGHVTRRSVAS